MLSEVNRLARGGQAMNRRLLLCSALRAPFNLTPKGVYFGLVDPHDRDTMLFTTVVSSSMPCAAKSASDNFACSSSYLLNPISRFAKRTLQPTQLPIGW